MSGGRECRNGRRAGMAAAGILFLFILSGMRMEAWASEKEEVQEETGKLQQEMVDNFDYGDVDKALRELFPEDEPGFKEILEPVLAGDQKFSLELLWRLVCRQLTYAFEGSRRNLAHILVLGLIAAVFHHFSNVFGSRQVCEMSFYITYLLLIALCLNSFQLVMEWVSGGIEKLTMFMSVFCPVYFLSVSVAKGSVTAVAFYNLVLFFIYLTEVVIVYFLIPAIHVYIMVKVLDFLSSQEYLSKFAELIEVMVSWLLKTLVACTLGFNVVQGMISPAVDTVKRSAVTRTAEAIPGVGDAIGGVTEVVFGTAVLVKNGIGATGMLICLALCIIPLAQTGLVALMYKLAAALIQPLSDKRIAGCVECVGDGCRLLMRVSFTAGFLFLLTIAVVSFVTGSV